jgi:hypothetical protein
MSSRVEDPTTPFSNSDHEVRRLALRHLRKIMSVGFPIVGMIVVFLALLIPTVSDSLQLQIGVVLVGLLIIESGVWRLTDKILPNERKYTSLRLEVEEFLEGVRVLNTRGRVVGEQGTEAELELFEETKRELHEAVDRMAKLAGKEG